jgi:hypothetical protein
LRIDKGEFCLLGSNGNNRGNQNMKESMLTLITTGTAGTLRKRVMRQMPALNTKAQTLK